MDIGTIMKIIQMMDTRIEGLTTKTLVDGVVVETLDYSALELKELRDDLQFFVEGELNAAENNTGGE